MRAYDIAIAMLCIQIGAGLFITVLNIGLQGENSFVESIPDAFIFYDKAGSVGVENENWVGAIGTYESNTYGAEVDDSASAEASSWGNIVRGFKVWNILKFGIFGVGITIYTLLIAASVGGSTSTAIATGFQLVAFFVWSTGILQYIRGTSLKEFE